LIGGPSHSSIPGGFVFAFPSSFILHPSSFEFRLAVGSFCTFHPPRAAGIAFPRAHAPSLPDLTPCAHAHHRSMKIGRHGWTLKIGSKESLTGGYHQKQLRQPHIIAEWSR
jgi:hypothetical protein